MLSWCIKKEKQFVDCWFSPENDKASLNKVSISVFDATGKIESGIQKGHFYFIGSYDQCYDARPKVEKHYAVAGGTTITRTFGTRFCRADIKISDTLIKALNVVRLLTFLWQFLLLLLLLFVFYLRWGWRGEGRWRYVSFYVFIYLFYFLFFFCMN